MIETLRWPMNPLVTALAGFPSSRQALDAFRADRLRQLVQHAYRQVPYYRRLFDQHGVDPSSIRSLADLGLRIPISSRQGLQHLPHQEIVAQGVKPDRLIVRRTSGWSGMPFHVRRTWLEERILNGLRWRARRYFGVCWRDRLAIVGPKRSRHPQDNPWAERLLGRLGLCRTTVLDCCLPTAELARQLSAAPPQVLVSMPGVLAHLAEELERAPIRPRLLLSGGEVLTPALRRRITTSLGVPLFDQYGAYEFNLIAWQCRDGAAYHVCDEAVIVEVLRDGRPAQPGERGEVVITGLHSFAMPLLRYRLGDVVTQGEPACRCGLPYPTIRAIQGRMLDYFLLPGGRRLHPYSLWPRAIDVAPWIRQSQLLQARRDLIILSAVPIAAPSDQDRARLHAAMGEILGPGVEFRLELVAQIAAEPSGKFRPLRSLLHSEYEAFDWQAEMDPAA